MTCWNRLLGCPLTATKQQQQAILKAYLDWHSMAAHAKLYYLPRSFLIRLLDELTDDELNELACDVSKNDLVDISLFPRGRV